MAELALAEDSCNKADVECKLPKVKGRGNLRDSDYYKHCDYLSQALDLGLEWRSTTVAIIAEYFDLSLRETERLYTSLALFQAVQRSKLGDGAAECLIPFLIALRMKAPEQYQALVSGNMTAHEFSEKYSINSLEDYAREWSFIRDCFIPLILMEENEIEQLEDSNPVKNESHLKAHYSNLMLEACRELEFASILDK